LEKRLRVKNKNRRTPRVSEYNINDKAWDVMLRNIATAVSLVFSAPFIGLYVAVRTWLCMGGDYLVLVTMIITLAIAPLLIPTLWALRHGIEWDYPEKKHRFKPFILVILNYLFSVVFFAMYWPGYPLFLSLAYLMNSIVAILLNLWTKVSLHTIGVVGPALTLYYLGLYIDSIILLIIALIVMYSRYVLRRHSITQLLLGFITAVTTTTLSWIIYQYMTTNIIGVHID